MALQAAQRKTGAAEEHRRQPGSSLTAKARTGSHACRCPGEGIRARTLSQAASEQKQRIKTLETQVHLSSILVRREKQGDVPPPQWVNKPRTQETRDPHKGDRKLRPRPRTEKHTGSLSAMSSSTVHPHLLGGGRGERNVCECQTGDSSLALSSHCGEQVTPQTSAHKPDLRSNSTCTWGRCRCPSQPRCRRAKGAAPPPNTQVHSSDKTPKQPSRHSGRLSFASSYTSLGGASEKNAY